MVDHRGPHWVNAVIVAGFVLAFVGILLSRVDGAEYLSIIFTVVGVGVSAAVGLWDSARVTRDGPH